MQVPLVLGGPPKPVYRQIYWNIDYGIGCRLPVQWEC